MLDGEDSPSDEVSSQHATSVEFVRKKHRWSSESSDVYMVMAIRRKRETLLKIFGPKQKIKINGHPINIWIDSGSPKSIFTMDELTKTLGRTGIELSQKKVEDDKFPYYSSNRIKLLGKVGLELASNGWKARIEFRVIGGNKPSIVGRNPMGNLCLQLMQTNPGETVMNIQGTQGNGNEQAGDPEDQDIDPWQQLISRLFPKFFTRTGKITTYKVPANFSNS